MKDKNNQINIRYVSDEDKRKFKVLCAELGFNMHEAFHELLKLADKIKKPVLK